MSINVGIFTNANEITCMEFDEIVKAGSHDILSSTNVEKFLADIETLEKAEGEENKIEEISKAREDFAMFTEISVLNKDLSKNTFFIRKKESV